MRHWDKVGSFLNLSFLSALSDEQSDESFSRRPVHLAMEPEGWANVALDGPEREVAVGVEAVVGRMWCGRLGCPRSV